MWRWDAAAASPPTPTHTHPPTPTHSTLHPEMPLEGYDRTQWICLEHAMVVKDTFTGGVRTFLNREDAHLFRRMMYAQFGLPPPTLRAPLPRVITFQRKRANRRVVNEPELLNMLAEFGEVRRLGVGLGGWGGGGLSAGELAAELLVRGGLGWAGGRAGMVLGGCWWAGWRSVVPRLVEVGW